MHVKSCCFAYEINLLFFDVLVAVSSSDLEVPNCLSNEDVDANNNGKKEMGLAMFTLCWIAFGPLREPYRIVLLFIHQNGDFGATSVAERS